MVLTEDMRIAGSTGIRPFLQDNKEKNSAYHELLAIIRDNKIKITTRGEAGQPVELSPEQIEMVFKRFFPTVIGVKGGFYEGQLRAGMKNAVDVLNAIAIKPPDVREMTIEKLTVVLTIDKTDDDIMDVFRGQLSHQNDRRLKTRDELKLLTVELKTYGIIQSKVSQSMAEKGGDKGSAALNIATFNLLKHDLYGYETKEKFKESAEFAFLKKLSKSTDDFLSIKDFLQSGPKASGQMQGLKDVYIYSKDNHDLSHLATTVNDAIRPVNDMVSEKTTLLSDGSTHYNSAIEASSRFSQKHNDMLREILRAI